MYEALSTTYSVGAWREYLAKHSPVKPLELGPIDPRRCALVLVDMQRKMVDQTVDPELSVRGVGLLEHSGGSNEADRSRWMNDTAVPNAVRLLECFRDRKCTVLHFATGPQLPGAEDLPLSYRLILQPQIDRAGHAVHWESPEYEFPDHLAPRRGELVIRKRTRSGFASTDAEVVLRALGITDLVLVGGATEACVEATARGASDAGFKVYVVEDAVIPCTPLNQQASMIAIACFFGEIRTTESVLADLTSSPGHDR